MIKITLDTNVYLSALFWKSAPHEIFLKILKGEVANCVSSEILEEVETTLLSKFHAPKERVSSFIESIVFSGEVVRPNITVNTVTDDPTDNKIIECAIEGNADFIVTGDQHLLKLYRWEGINIVTPRIFLDKMLESQTTS